MRKLSSHCHLFVKRWHFTFSWLTLINAISTFKVNQTQVEFGFSDCYHLTKKFSAIKSIIGKISEIQAAFNCGPSSHPDFIKNYFLCERMSDFFDNRDEWITKTLFLIPFNLL